MSRHRFFLVPILVFGLGVSLQLHAAENTPSPNSEMDALISAGQFQEAFNLGNANLVDWEGDAEFDFIYGLAALESGNPNDAVFALERVTATAEDQLLRARARLELARAYFVTNNLTAAENLFNLVLESDPPANVQENIQAFLTLIESRRNAREATFNWSIATVVGSDDNINSATSNGLIDTPLVGQIELNQDGQETDDNFYNTSASMVYNYPITRDQSIAVNVNLTHLDNLDTDQFDIDSARAEVAYNWGNDKNRFRHGVSVTKVILDQNSFQDSIALNSSWQRDAGNGWYQSISASYAQIRFDTDTGGASAALRDIDQLLITGGLTKIAGPYTHSFNLYHAIEDPENPDGGEHNGRDFSGFAYSLFYRLNAQHTPYLRASFQDVEHDNEHPVFFRTVRSDETESLTVGWFWQLAPDWVITAEAAYTDNKSDIPLFDFSRFKYQAGFRFNF